MKITKKEPARPDFVLEVIYDELFNLFVGIADIDGNKFNLYKRAYRCPNVPDQRVDLYGVIKQELGLED